MQTLTKEDTELYTGTDKSKAAHYIKKREAGDAYVFGTEVEALCGYRWVPTQNPDRFPVCAACKAVFDTKKKPEGE